MKNVYKSKREQGFTIIEVMIVLAIAAVILLIVLLAVPALQRNSRNTQRNNDAAQMAAAVNTCIANQNGDVTKCKSIGTSNVDIAVDASGNPTKFGQLTNPPSYATPPVGDINTVSWGFKYNCVGNTPTATTSNRSFAVSFFIETTGVATQRCVDS
jgi:prepilin-type N-terminal cleavage/methylation domain-containing protein